MLGLLYIALALGGCLFVVFSAVSGMGDGGHVGHVGHGHTATRAGRTSPCCRR